MYPTLHILKGREKSIERFHPWVFSGSVHHADGTVTEGDLVRLLSADGVALGVGHAATGSISAKVLSFKDEVIDRTWFTTKLQNALQLRAQLSLPHTQTTAYRLVHGEGDGLPGLIIDVYADVAVVQPHSAGMERALDDIAAALQQLGFAHVLLKPVGKGEPKVLAGKVSERITVRENGMTFHVDVIHGQKTGFFLDQRDSRHLLSTYSAGRSVLNVFSYTGGFSIAALRGGAARAVSLDSAAPALDMATENATLNGFSDRHTSLRADAVPFLENMADAYDIIVLDPPAFAKHKSARHNAIQAYRRINEAALRRVNKGGMIFTFSCSQVIDRQLFYDIVASASINTGRNVRVLHHLRQPADHPVSIFHPEGEYLKGLVLNVT